MSAFTFTHSYEEQQTWKVKSIWSICIVKMIECSEKTLNELNLMYKSSDDFFSIAFLYQMLKSAQAYYFQLVAESI